MATLNNGLITLTEAQKALVMGGYEKMTLSELVSLVFPGAKADGRTTEGRSIQAFLMGMDRTAQTSSTVKTSELSEDQKKQITELIEGGKVKNSVEMAKLIFGPKTKQLSSDWRLVYTYMNEIAPELFATVDHPVVDKEYQPPSSIPTLIGIVNRFVSTGDSTRKTYNPNTLKISETRNLRSLMSYIRIYRFTYVASTYEKQVDRDLFLSTFIRWTHNKPDLTEMEQDQMISAAAETVNVAQMEREIQDIKKYHESVMAGDEVDDKGNKKRFGMIEIEQINGVRTKHDQAKARLKQLMEALEATRATRLENIKDRNASILNLFEAWQTDPEWRSSLLALGAQEKKEDRDEVKRLAYDMDDTIALISGQTMEEGGA